MNRSHLDREQILRLNRHGFLGGVTTALIGATGASRMTVVVAVAKKVPDNPFTLGVTSGEPQPDGSQNQESTITLTSTPAPHGCLELKIAERYN